MRARGPPPDATEPRSAGRSSGALVEDRCRQLPVVFFAGTAVGFARRAVRARVTVLVVAFAGDFLAAGLVFLAGAVVAVVAAGLGAAGLGAVVVAAAGVSTALSTVALVDSAASSTFSSALAAALLALAAVFWATEV